jgi:proline iminopeptidase
MRRFLVLALTAASILLASVSFAAPGVPSGPGHTIIRKGQKLWYEVRGGGSGVPLVLCNGGPGFDHTYELCSDAWDRLGHNRPVVLWDQRGNGRSGPLATGGTCTLVDQIDDLDAIRAAIGADKIEVVGHSWGGYLAMVYAARHPEHVAHLIIVDSASPKWTDTDFLFKYIFPQEMEQQAALDGRDALGDPDAAAKSLQMYLGWLFYSQENRDEFMAGAKNYQYSRVVNETLNAELEKKDNWPVLPGITAPTLVISGRFDINVAPSTAFKIHRNIPGSRFVLFEKSGHMPFFEESDKFVNTVESFLAGH